MGGNADDFLCAQMAYIQSMETNAQVDTATESAVNYIILTQLGMKAGINKFGKTGAEAIYG